jgi:hypothetical protein
MQPIHRRSRGQSPSEHTVHWAIQWRGQLLPPKSGHVQVSVTSTARSTRHPPSPDANNNQKSGTARVQTKNLHVDTLVSAFTRRDEVTRFAPNLISVVLISILRMLDLSASTPAMGEINTMAMLKAKRRDPIASSLRSSANANGPRIVHHTAAFGRTGWRES